MSERDDKLEAVRGTASTQESKADESPVVVVDGPCLRKTMARISDMPEEALAKVCRQSERLVARVLGTYAAEFGPGEVGLDGSARAGTNRAEDLGPTGLLYGRIQSGKTLAMISFTAMAVDNGFRVIVVLTTNFLELVQQTKDRFNDLGRVLVRASTDPDEWTKDAEIEHLKNTVPKRGLVMICAKHAGHLEKVNGLLAKIGGADLPALILDDEADQASLDNNERKRSRSKSPVDVKATAVHAAIFEIRKDLRHHVFLQVTATPYALLLQRVSSPLRPKFTFLLKYIWNNFTQV